MNRLRNLYPAIVGALAAVAFALALMHLVALTNGGAFQVGDLRLAVIAAGYDRGAEKLLVAPQPAASDLRVSEKLTRLAIAEFPYDTSAWLRLAYINQLPGGRLSEPGVAALAQSYNLVAIDPGAGPWRIHFALEHWPELPKNIKNSVRDEARAMSPDGKGRLKLAAALRAVKNPHSTAIAALWLERYVVQPSRDEHKAPEKEAVRRPLLND